MGNNAVLVFLKAPEKGRVKTRLSKILGESFVLELYRGFIRDTLLVLPPVADKFICFLPAEKQGELRSWLGDEYQYVLQTGRDLGEKMSSAFKHAFSKGYDRLVLIGTDIPELTETALHHAFDALETKDAVIGPASDGGYYLIGFKKESFSEKIFHGMRWSTATVFRETLKAMGRLDLQYEQIQELNDVDTVEDLNALSFRIKNEARVGPYTRNMLLNHES